MKATGSHDELAKKLEVPRTTLYDTISFLREEMNAPIIYNEHAKSFEYIFLPKFYLSSEIKNSLSVRGDAGNAYKGNNPKVSNSDSDENEIADETFEETMESSELIDVYGGLNKGDWNTDPFDDDSDDVVLDHNINFNDLYFDNY